MKLTHGNKLIPSSRDDVALGVAVEQRYLDLVHTYRRVKGVDIMIPESLDADMLRWRQMRVRHKSGDYRHTEAELSSVKEIATWTVQANCVLRGQPPKHVVWREEAGIDSIQDAKDFLEGK